MIAKPIQDGVFLEFVLNAQLIVNAQVILKQDVTIQPDIAHPVLMIQIVQHNLEENDAYLELVLVIFIFKYILFSKT